MKATIEMLGGRYHITGLSNTNKKNLLGDTIYEMVYLHTFSGKSYKTLSNAMKALEKNGFEYIANPFMVCAYD